MTDIRKALNQAFYLGQTYWQQADSESYAQNLKSLKTMDAFRALLDKTCAALAQRADEPVAQAFYKDADAEPPYAQFARGVKEGFALGMRNATQDAAAPATERADTERIDHLESLMRRQQFQNQSRPTESVGSDMHMGDGQCSLYVRDLLGNTVEAECGHGESVREAIDASRSKV